MTFSCLIVAVFCRLSKLVTFNLKKQKARLILHLWAKDSHVPGSAPHFPVTVGKPPPSLHFGGNWWLRRQAGVLWGLNAQVAALQGPPWTGGPPQEVTWMGGRKEVPPFPLLLTVAPSFPGWGGVPASAEQLRAVLLSAVAPRSSSAQNPACGASDGESSSLSVSRGKSPKGDESL